MIRVVDLSYSYGLQPIFSHANFHISANQKVGLVGANGSGKSTLLDNVIYQGLVTQKHQLAEDPAQIGSIKTFLKRLKKILLSMPPPQSANISTLIIVLLILCFKNT